MSLKTTLKKLLKAGGAVDKIVRQFDESRPSQADAFSVSANARRAIEEALAAAEPAILPSVPFVSHGGEAPLAVAFQGRFRRFVVEVASIEVGATARGATFTPLRGAITIDVSYPSAPTVEIEGVVYSVKDLSASDADQMDLLIRSEPGVSILPARGAFSVNAPTSSFEAGNTIRRTRWVCTWRQPRA